MGGTGDRRDQDRAGRGGERTRRRVVLLVAAVAAVASACVLNGDWQLLTPANPTPRADVALVGVSCPTATFCMAIASRPGAIGALASVQTWDGSTWTLLPFEPAFTPDPDDFGIDLRDVACASPRSCVVSWFRFHDDEDLPYVSGWNGSGWVDEAIGGAGPFASQVGCAPGGACVDALDGEPTVVWDGSAFTTRADPAPELTDLSCPSSTRCVGLGVDGDSLTWDGTTWATTAVPLPGSTPDTGGERWTALTCTAPNLCLAVGGARSGDPIAARFDGTAWTATPVPLTGGTLTSVSCANPAACVAVGTATVGTPSASHVVAVGWNGAQWFRLDDPPSAPGLRLVAVSCPPSDRCVAVGSSTSGTRRIPYAARYTWTSQP